MSIDNQLNAAINFGLLVDFIEPDGQIHRVSTVDKPTAKNGWYLSFQDGGVMVLGNWKTGLTYTHKEDRHCFSRSQKRAITQAITNAKKRKEVERKRAANLARNLYAEGKHVAYHPYLNDKQIQVLGDIKMKGQNLLIPLVDLQTGTISNLQVIQPYGQKRFLKHGRVKGLCCPIALSQQPPAALYIAEGYATAVTVHLLTKSPVLAALNAGNLLAVAKLARQKWPDAEIIISGDNDWVTEQVTGINPGKQKAIEAAAQVNGKVSFPPFMPEQLKAGMTDWNDYFVTGLREVAACIKM